MWRKALQVIVCWWSLSEAYGEKIVKHVVVKDSSSAANSPRLYRNAPFGVYASAAPYAAYSFQIPAFINAPKPAGTTTVPVKDQLVLQSTNAYLMDSYGNKYAGSPQVAAYTAFPQQFVSIQDLPAHLSQPLLAAAPQTKQASPHYFAGPQFPQYRLPAFQLTAQPVSSVSSFSTLHNQVPGIATAQQQPSSNKAVYANAHFVEQFKTQKDAPKFQRLENSAEKVHENDDTNEGSNELSVDKAALQETSERTAVPTVINGQKTVVNIPTKPALPLLDLSLLEPLTFDNPLVPQVQHYLPRINEATYHKLPQFDSNIYEQTKDNVVPKLKTQYGNGNVKGKPNKSGFKKKPKHHSSQHQQQSPAKPNVNINAPTNANPEVFYEINSPNYRETYNEKSITYNKNTHAEPVHYTYEMKIQPQPVHYSFKKTENKPAVNYNVVHKVHKQPIQIKHNNFQSGIQFPRQLIYTFQPNNFLKRSNGNNVQYVGNDSSEENKSSEASYEQTEVSRDDQHSNDGLHHKPSNDNHNHDNDKPEHREVEYHHRPNDETRHETKEHHHQLENYHHRENHHHHHHHVPNQEHQSKINQNYNHAPNREGLNHYPQEQFYHSFPHKDHVKNSESQLEKVPHNYEEIIHHAHHEPHSAAIKVDPGQHQQPKKAQEPVQPSENPETHHQHHPQSQREESHHNSEQPFIHEKAKRIIIQEETPEELHMHQEHITAEVMDEQNNNEEEFEKAYKNAAFGFPAFEKKRADIEKDIYNPDSYGVPLQDNEYNVEAKIPFEQYGAKDDTFPKTARSMYQKTRDNIKEDYYLDYSVNKPESLTDRLKSKVNYYKLYKQYKPERFFDDDQDNKKEKKQEKYTVPVTFDFEPASTQRSNGYFQNYKVEPIKFEYDYSKSSPQDSSAHASRPYQRLGTRTHFVDPQFQYGFEPSTLPRLLDSELAAMASNNSPESEKPGMRKKIYQENWYIKKTSTSGGKPS